VSNLIIYKDLKLSRPEVGSSSIIIEGSVINSTAIAVLFLSPPEIVFLIAVPIVVLADPTKLRSFISYSTFSSYSYIDVFNLILAAKVIASLGVKY